jgi:hypothetical protein
MDPTTVPLASVYGQLRITPTDESTATPTSTAFVGYAH